MKIQTKVSLVVSACLLVASATPGWAASFGGSFVGRGGGAGAMLSHAESAGVIPQTFWNNIDSGDPVVDGSSLPLIDSAGAFTAVKIIYDCSDSWNSDGGTTTPDEKLMKGIIKANPDPDLAPANNTDRMVFVVTNLPPAGTYNIIVYATANGQFAKMDLSVGSITNYIEEQNNFTTQAGGAFLAATSTTPGVYELGPNYAGFTNVSPAANGTITIMAKKFIEDDGATPPVQRNDGIGVAGIQIIQNSGPAPAPNTQTCSITTDPQSPPAVVEGGAVTLTVGTQGPCKVQWTKNNVPISGAIAPTLVYPTTTAAADNGAQIRAVVYNNVNTNTSNPAILEVDANTPPVLTQYFMKVERWTGMTGTSVQPVKDAIANSTPPNETFFLGAGVQVPQTSPDLNDFGVRLSGWVKPTVTGEYDFFIRSDDASQLYLNPINSTTGTNTLPDVNVDLPIAEETGCCDAFKEPNYVLGQPFETASAPTYLEAGKLYGIVVLLKEGGGGDYVQVAWRLTNGTPAAAALLPISQPNTWTLASPAGQRASITTQPTPQTVTELQTANFTVGVTTTPLAGQYALQWFANGVAIPGATASTYSLLTSLSDSNKQIHVVAQTLRGPLTSSVVKLSVLADSTSPVVTSAGAIRRNDGIVQVGIGFNERLNPVTVIPANFNLSAGSVTSVSLATNGYGDYTAVTLNTSGLTVGNSYTVSVHDVTDVRGNLVAPTSPSITVNSAAWADTGVHKRPGQVIPVGTDGFDVLNGGRGEWDTYDEATIAYVRKTNDFDVKVRVVYAEPGSQWTRVGLMARNALNAGEPSSNGTGGGTNTSAYAQTHVNPTLTIAQANRFDPAGATPGNPNSNNGHEQNQRVTAGAATSGWGTTATAPAYPNEWLRLKREGDTLFGFRGTNGVDWVAQGSTVLLDQQPDMFVGTFAAVETANIWTSGHNVWTSPFDPRYDRLFVYQFRNFGDFVIAPPTPTLSFSRSGATIIITYTGVLQSSAVVTGPYGDVSGATNPYTAPTTGAQLYFRARSN